MLIRRKSMISGRIHEMEINVTEAQLNAWMSGMLIQNAMPHLSADEREFIMTGITADEWNAAFADHDEV